VAEKQTPDGAWPWLIEHSGGNTTSETYEEYQQAIADGDTGKAQQLMDQASRSVTPPKTK
jgi:hypothetical protein